MDKQFDHETKIWETKIRAEKRRGWIVTIDGECPECSSHSLIKHVDVEATVGCLVCGWKEIDSIDESIQKALNELKRTAERISTSKLFYF